MILKYYTIPQRFSARELFTRGGVALFLSQIAISPLARVIYRITNEKRYTAAVADGDESMPIQRMCETQLDLKITLVTLFLHSYFTIAHSE